VIALAGAPAAAAGDASVSWTLEVRQHGRLVQTATFAEREPQTDVGRRPFLRPGYWTIDLWQGKSTLAIDTEAPFDQLGQADATNVEVRTAPGPRRRTFFVVGTAVMHRHASITVAGAFIWFCPNDERLRVACASGGSGFRTRTPHPVSVAAGDRVTVTAVIRITW